MSQAKQDVDNSLNEFIKDRQKNLATCMPVGAAVLPPSNVSMLWMTDQANGHNAALNQQLRQKKVTENSNVTEAAFKEIIRQLDEADKCFSKEKYEEAYGKYETITKIAHSIPVECIMTNKQIKDSVISAYISIKTILQVRIGEDIEIENSARLLVSILEEAKKFGYVSNGNSPAFKLKHLSK